ncbi:MAG: tyrosine-type recombinase/integrase, partial [Chloroflexota bacterium]
LHRRRVSLKKFAEFLSDRGELEKSSVQEVAGWQQNLWVEIASREAVYLSEDEVDLLFKVMDLEDKPRNLRDKAIISLILGTGVSIGTLVELNLSDLNLQKHRVRVDIASNQWFGIVDSVEYLEQYLVISRPELTQTASEEALFVSQMGGRITRQGAWQVIKAWGIAAGLEIALSPRVLRHTAVRRMIEQDKPLKKIQQMLGHNNEHSTQALLRKILKSMDLGGLNGQERIYHD